MKKFLCLSLVFSALISIASFAQTGSGPSEAAQKPAEYDADAVLRQMKEKTVPLMVEKTGLTQAQAERVVELNFEMRQAAGALKDLGEEERRIKIKELKAVKERKMNELLTAEQLAAVKTFYEEMGKKSGKG